MPAELPLPADIRRRIARDFDPADASALLVDIAAHRTTGPKIFSDRIVRCIIYVARGDLEIAGRAIAMALADPRDLIVWAEYDNKFDQQLRDLNLPFE